MNLLPQLLKTGPENGFAYNQDSTTNYNNNADPEHESQNEVKL